MASTWHSPQSSPPPGPRPGPQPDTAVDVDPPKLDLKPTQLAGGALAAVTSAVAASKFGVTGTVVGAAFGSLVSSVAAAVYATSLTRASRRIRTVVVTPSGARGGIGTSDPSDPAAVPADLTGAASPIVADTMLLPNGMPWPPEPPAPTDPAYLRPDASPASEPPPPAGRRRWVRPVLILGGFAFAASIGAISVTELVLGHPVADSGGGGTSVSRFLGDDGGSRPSSTPSVGPSSTDVPSGTASPTDTASPTASGSGTPSGSPSDSGAGASSDGGNPQGTQSGQDAVPGTSTGGDGGGAAQPSGGAPATSAPLVPAP